MPSENTSWVLEEFVDALVLDLDKTRETLAVKSINKPLSYSVKEFSIDLNAFPTYDGDAVKFVTAQPGQQGASKVTIQLGSITDQQVRATSNLPTLGKPSADIQQLPVSKTAKKALRKLGVKSLDDIQRLQKQKVDLGTATDGDIDYSALANEIEKGRRAQSPPSVANVALSMSADRQGVLTIRGANLAVNAAFEPVAVVNGRLAKVAKRTPSEMQVVCGPEHRLGASNDVILTVDPYAIVKFNVARPR